MGERTEISWAHHTFNPVIGCTRVSAACDHCYAADLAKRYGWVEWDGPPKRTSAANWHEPLKWNRKAARAGVRRRVFSPSLADPFDNQWPNDWRADFWALIAECTHLDWLLLTKRPQNIAKMLPGSYVEQLVGRDLPWPWPHVWLGVTVENQEEADRRIPILLSVPAAVHWLSCEPLLEPLNLVGVPRGRDYLRSGVRWVVLGGESGPKARDFRLSWAQDVASQCDQADIPCFMKQLGSNAWDDISYDGSTPRYLTRDRKGGDMDEFPKVLQVREFPR